MLDTFGKEEPFPAVLSPTTPSPPPPPPTASVAAANPSVAVDDKCATAGKKATRQWEAWTHQEEESFFVALRHVGKNFDKITSKVQSKNKDQVRHYYYRVIRRINKLLGPGFSLDAKNTKDANSAMLRWWSLLEKQSCSASKLHLKPRRFKTFVTALEHQLLKDRLRANQKRGSPRAVPVVVTPVARKSTAGTLQEFTKAIVTDESLNSKLITGKAKHHKRQELSQAPKRRRKGFDCGLSATAIKRWEKAASAGVSLVAEAAEQVEREAFEHFGQTGPNLKEEKLCPQVVRTKSVSLLNTQSLRTEVNTMEGRKEDGKLRLQLYPIDENTQKAMEKDGLYPFLQLTLKPRKPISSVVRHLIQKWGQCSAAVGEFHLFPFNAQMENIGGCKNWSSCYTNATAGDVFSSLGHPSVFRLRYGWLSSRILRSSQADCVKEDTGLQIDAASSIPVLLSSSDPPHLPCCANTGILRRASFNPRSGEALHNRQGFVDPLGLHYRQLSASPCMAAHHTQGVAISKKCDSLSCTNNPNSLLPLDCRTINSFGPGSTDFSVPVEKTAPDISEQKVQESGDNLGSCSWLYDGSNDSFIHRIWAIQNSPNAAPASLFPSDSDWADTVTNISVGEFLNEVSQANQSTQGLASVQALQKMKPFDSLDGAVAAQGGEVTGIESKLIQSPETCAWDGEETRDAFSFQRLISQKQTSPHLHHSVEPANSAQTLREQDGMTALYVDCGSLEAWKQSFNYTEPSFSEDFKLNLNSQCPSQQLEYLLNGDSTQDFTWANVQAQSRDKDPFLSKTKGINAVAKAKAEKVHHVGGQDNHHVEGLDEEIL